MNCFPAVPVDHALHKLVCSYPHSGIVWAFYERKYVWDFDQCELELVHTTK